MFETKKERAEIYRWMFLAIRLNGAVDGGKYDHVDTMTVLKHIEEGDIFEFLGRTLGADVDYALTKLTDADRHALLKYWRTFAGMYDIEQFHVARSGLALLVAYLLHLIHVRHATVP
jgi:hypothetical protein